ncbi:MAG: aldo/keto reductase [Clostridia bacterium]|nr:aldo/keto reductase [Clostridia bacterium]
MIYKDFKGKKLSLLGFGTMRLPTKADGSVDKEMTAEMTDIAIKNGVNYFDTAVPYHGGESEKVMGEILARYPRHSFYLASKYPGHQIFETYDPAAMFEDQLERCRVEYFDFYLLHNVFENSIHTYKDARWGIIDYFIKQKQCGRIKHLGFSTHGGLDVIEEFLDLYGEHMEFCQLQVNYLDWTLQNAKEKCELMASRGIPVWVMEPVRGGGLVNLKDEDIAKLKAKRPEDSVASWGFRWLQGLDNIGMILSGMSNKEQMLDNLNTFTTEKPLTMAETELLYEIAEGMKKSVPCTACRYCTDGCPMGLDIPKMLGIYNELQVEKSVNIAMRLEFLPEDKKSTACIGCGACTAVCPQKIDIPQYLAALSETITSMPTWTEVSRQRAEALKKLKQK